MCELLQTEAGQSWQLSYVHKAVYIAIQWGGDGGPRDTDGTIDAYCIKAFLCVVLDGGLPFE